MKGTRMKNVRILLFALLLPLAVSAATSSTNLFDISFRDAKLTDVAEFISEKSGLKLLVPEGNAEIPVSAEMTKATPEDALELVALRLVCDGSTLGWKESPLTDGQKAYVLTELPAPVTKPLGDCVKQFKGLPRSTIQLRQAQLTDVANFLQKLTGGGITLVYGEGMAETPVDLKLKDVTAIDALLSMNELFKSSGMSMAWRGVELPSGRIVFALLDTTPAMNPAEAAGTEGSARVYFIGDLGADTVRTVQSVHELIGTAQLRAEINFHEPTQMLVVRGEDEAHAFVKNVIEELRRGATKPVPAAPEAK